MDSKAVKLKLVSHQKNYREVDLLISVKIKDLGLDVKENDIIEIYHPETDEHQPRLLLQILHFEDDINVQKDSISVEQNIAMNFQLRAYQDVIVNKIDPKSVVLDLLELTFKDLYLGRSDMWRLKRSLVNTVVYLNKKVEFCATLIRCQAYEMWAQGEKVACGVVGEDTKVVFRSSTCQAYLFIQMSSEMWEFDLYGDLYFEKAVNGFLAELFTKWKKEGSNHDVTIVLFSRTYYKAHSIEEFPVHMRECLQEDYQGRFYEDFYRVAVQNDRYDDWLPILSHLRFLFHNYLKDVLENHAKLGCHIPEAYNSNAVQGNFLEVLNISLNVFEKHYLDRSFDRTGQMSVVITPGVGVFEVDRELTNITKQRIIDNGVGSDLVCVGEQPLHAVPLLKFHKKRGSFKADDYSMPHTWINLSFYSSNRRAPGCGSFVPRIKVPQEILKLVSTNKPLYPTLSSMKPVVDDSLPNAKFDYDAYDAQVFKVPTNQTNRTYRSLQRAPARKKATSQSSAHNPPRVGFHRKLSDSDLFRSAENVSTSFSSGITSTVSNLLGKSPAINIPSKIFENKLCSHSFGALNIEGSDKRISATHDVEETSSSYVSKIGSSGANSPNEFHTVAVGRQSARPGRSLINPFDPSHVTVKLTSNRRRWIHTFPKGPTGNLIQQHHYQVHAANLSDEEDLLERLGEVESRRIRANSDRQSQDSFTTDESLAIILPKTRRQRTISANDGWITTVNSISSSVASTRGTNSPQKITAYSMSVPPPPTPVVGLHQIISSANNKHETLLWGATGEQEWHAEITTGVDWKSLTLPACLPLTTDYFPDKQSLHYDYEVAANYSRVRPDNIENMFLELVSQRLTQGFQLVMRPDEADVVESVKNFMARSRISRQEDFIQEHKLSIGRVFHRVQWKDSSIDVTIYRPKHPYAQLDRKYKYLFRAPYMSSYKISFAEFKTERLENYKWNYLDNYVCFQGDPRECRLLEEFKYWRVRLMILPDLFKLETKRLMDTSNNSPCDIYHSITQDEKQATVENFLRLMEVIHRIKRPNTGKKARGGATGMRERLGSNRMNERPRNISGGKVQERHRFESGNKEEGITRNSTNDFFEDECKDEGELKKFSLNMNTSDIVEAMRDPVNGIQCITPHRGLPKFTFVAADATFWIHKHVEEIATEKSATEFLQVLVDEGYIKHISEDRLKQFIHGFYLYFFITGNKDHDYVSLDLTSLECDFYEVAIDPCNFKKVILSTCPSFLSPELSKDNLNGSSYNVNQIPSKDMYQFGCLEVDISTKSDRYEWGHLKYQTKYSPNHCYELTMQWMCATGTVVNDLVSTWQRKATNLNLHLFPVPNDPFALPFSFNSNPLRGPIVVSLNVESLKDNCNEMFPEINANMKDQRLHLFQKAILEKFGFLSYATEGVFDMDSHFIHVTGNAMVLISNELTSARIAKMQDQEPHKKNSITHSFLGSLSSQYPEPCFLWIFNYMLTKRWKSSTSGDEILGEKILKDFKEFCDNHNHRLRVFWDSFLTPLIEPPVSPTHFADVF